MGKLFEFKTAVSAGEFPKLVTCSWPLGKITFYRDQLEINALAEKYVLKYTDVDYIKTTIIQVQIEHHNPDIIKDITFDTMFLGNRIKKKVKKFGIPITIK